MQALYFVLAALHVVAIVVTGTLWVLIDLRPGTALKEHFRDVRAVHFGSLYLVPWFLGLAWAFERLHIPAEYQLAFPIGLGALVLFSGIGYLFPRPEGLDPFYYWTRGPALVLSVVGLACLVAALLWTAGLLVVYSLRA